MIVIFSYNRPGKLKKIIKHLKDTTDHDLFVVDDGSDFDMSMFDVEYSQNVSNGGKMNYWKQWNIALNHCKESTNETFIFMPDDFMDLDVKRIEQWIAELDNGKPYLVNLINDGRLECFQPCVPHPVQINNEGAHRVGFTDCGFFCNWRTLQLLNWNIIEIAKWRWENNPDLSSGVGQQLSKRLFGKVSMYVPNVSFAHHGNHESKMHPKERMKTPLISRH